MDDLTKEQKQIYADIVKNLISTIRKLPIYPPQHPMIKESVTQLTLSLQKAFSATKNITITWVDDKFLVEGTDVEGVTMAKSFSQDLRVMGLESLSISQGVTSIELIKLLGILSQKPELYQGKNLSDVLISENIRNITINTVRYEKISTEETVVKKDEVIPLSALGQVALDVTQTEAEKPKGAIPVMPAKDPKKYVIRFLSQEEAKENIGLKDEELAEYIKRHARSIAQALVKKAGKNKAPAQVLAQIRPQFDALEIAPEEKTAMLTSLENVIAAQILTKKSQKGLVEEIKKLEDENKALKDKLSAQEGSHQQLITEHKKIKQEKERIDNVVRNIAEGLVVVDANGKVLMLNPAAEKILGVNREQKIGSYLVDGLHDEHLVSMQKSGAIEQEIELNTKSDATKKTIKASTAVVENEYGQTVGMVSVLTDITKQKELDSLKSNFVASVSHELRAPLISIQKSLELIMEETPQEISPQHKKFLEIARNNSKRLYGLINDLLDVAKLESGRVKLDYTKIELSKFVSEVVSTLAPWANSKKINITSSCPEINFDADRQYLSQVLNNLLGNAIKFTDSGGGISIKGEIVSNISDMREGNYVKISVQDTGRGIPKDAIKKIFDKFVQVQAQGDSDVKGTGLGLSIVKHIINMHKGKIEVESEVGIGTTFSFYLPESVSQVVEQEV